MALGTEIALIKALGGGSGSLPPITDADNGKVLTANSGVWVAANPSAGGGVLVVHDVDGTLDKTWQEIHDADFAVVVFTVTAGKNVFPCTSVVKNRDQTEFTVTATDTYYIASSADGYPVAE